jgi:hypothetical protein
VRIEEAEYIGETLAALETRSISPVLNLGSSTEQFRQTTKPHIHKHVFQPLLDRHVSVVHADLKAERGVDISGNIFAEDTQARLRLVQPRLIMCCNMFEHVKDRIALSQAIDGLAGKGDYVLVSVPYSYPLHLDPIDTYFRPSPEQLCRLFPNFRLLQGKIIDSTTYLQDIALNARRGEELLKLGKRLITFFYPFYPPGEWRRRHHRLSWLFRRYKITVVLLRKDL